MGAPALVAYEDGGQRLTLFVLSTRFYNREDTEDAVKYISGTIVDDRPIRVDFDWGFQEGRQWGRGRSGGQVLVFFSPRSVSHLVAYKGHLFVPAFEILIVHLTVSGSR